MISKSWLSHPTPRGLEGADPDRHLTANGRVPRIDVEPLGASVPAMLWRMAWHIAKHLAFAWLLEWEEKRMLRMLKADMAANPEMYSSEDAIPLDWLLQHEPVWRQVVHGEVL